MEEVLKILHEETKKLKLPIESIELLTSNSNSEKGSSIGFLLKEFVNVKVKMYQENHNKPHIHIDIGKRYHVASIAIEDQEVLAGSIKPKHKKVINQWIDRNKENLLIIWENVKKGQNYDLSILS